ncbi:hypothetical protein P7K49_014718, partial [Saguinus oedipus]
AYSTLYSMLLVGKNDSLHVMAQTQCRDTWFSSGNFWTGCPTGATVTAVQLMGHCTSGKQTTCHS